jgi:hypothetical protein
MLLINLLIVLASHIAPEVHEFHVSKCLIEYKAEQAALQVSLHIFIDDLEEGLRRQGHGQLYLCTKDESKKADELVEAYLVDRLSLTVNGAPVSFKYIGKEISDDLAGAWCYMEVENIRSLESIDITNRLLMEVFDDQKNIVSVMGSGHRATLLFQRGQERKSATF